MKEILSTFLAVIAVLYSSHEVQVSTSTLSAKQQEVVNFQVVKNLTEFQENTSSFELQPLTRVVRYTLGHRKQGDKLLSVLADKVNFAFGVTKSSSQIKYPQVGTESTITFVEISFLNDTQGNAYLIGGGIGQSTISLLFVSNTTHFSYQAKIYGKE